MINGEGDHGSGMEDLEALSVHLACEADSDVDGK